MISLHSIKKVQSYNVKFDQKGLNGKLNSKLYSIEEKSADLGMNPIRIDL